MSFTTIIKEELCGGDLPHKAEKTVLYGFLYAMRGSAEFNTDSRLIADYICELVGRGNSELYIKKKKSSEGYAVALKNTGRLVNGADVNLPDISRRYVDGSDAQTGFFLRGVFLACGVAADPNKEYHLEMTVGDEKKNDRIFTLVNETGMCVKKSVRKGQHFVYTKESDGISDILTFIGAMINSMEIMNVKIYKDVRNNVNRAVNCEAANIGKTVAAGQRQIDDIELIAAEKGLNFLPEDLRQVAEIRRENIDLSLREIGELTNPKISRSGVNHRLCRIGELAEKLRGKNPE